MSPEFDSLSHLVGVLSLQVGVCGTSIMVIKFHLVFINLKIFLPYHFLFKFIPSTIFIIFSNPFMFKCSLFFTNSATLHQSVKSNALTPFIGYSLKKGIILFCISLLFLICNKQVLLLSEL